MLRYFILSFFIFTYIFSDAQVELVDPVLLNGRSDSLMSIVIVLKGKPYFDEFLVHQNQRKKNSIYLTKSFIFFPEKPEKFN